MASEPLPNNSFGCQRIGKTPIFAAHFSNISQKMKKLLLLAIMATSLALATEAQTIYKTPQYEWRGNQFTQGRFKA